MKKYLLILLLPLLMLVNTARAEMIVPDRPDNGIYDVNHLLSQSTANRVKEFNAEFDTHFDVYITDTLYGDSIDHFASNVAEYWLGRSKSDVKKIFTLVIATREKQIKLNTSFFASYDIDEYEADEVLKKSVEALESDKYDEAVTSAINELQHKLTKKYYDNAPESDEPESNLSHLDPKPNFFNSDQYRGAVYMFSAIILGVYVIPISIPIICFLIVYYIVKRKPKSKQENTESAITETKEQTSTNYEESKETSHFDSPFE